MPRVSREEISVVEVGFASWRGRPTPMPRLHRHEEIEINLVERGFLSYLRCGEFVTVRKGRMTLFWAAYPHRLVVFPRGTIAHWVNLPLSWFIQRKLPDPLTTAVLRGDMLVEKDAGEAALDLVMLNRWHADLQSREPSRARVVELELEARLCRLAWSSVPLVRAPGAGDVPLTGREQFRPDVRQLSKAGQMARFIATHYAEPLRVRDIARAVDLHPNYAMNLFRRMFGMRLHDYLTRHRLAHAQRLIVTTDMKFLDIALQAGFGSASRFYAAFHRHCGMTPSRYREIHLV